MSRKNYNDFNENNNDKEHIDDEINNIDDKIYELEKILFQMEKDIRKIWTYVILAYLNDINHRKILVNLDEYSYQEFYTFMLKNNKTYNYAFNMLNKLKLNIS